MGSAVHAKFLHDKGIPVKLMVSLEMVGYYSDQPNSQKFPISSLKSSYPTTGNFIIVVGRKQEMALTELMKSAMRQGSRIDVQALSATIMPGIDLSDHKNFWEQGYPAVMVTDTSFFRNPNYHKPTDTPEKLDYGRMAEVARGMYNVLLNL